MPTRNNIAAKPGRPTRIAAGNHLDRHPNYILAAYMAGAVVAHGGAGVGVAGSSDRG
jgi:hypothetical protein